MNERINPFNELYVTESISPSKYVDLFSPLIVENALALFQPGHIVLKGLIGSGKSMLLNLLKPEVRIAFYRANTKFPVPKPYHCFIGAGINLRRSGISDFGQRPIQIEHHDNDIISPIFFGDFLNYWIISDILESIRTLASEQELSEEIGIVYNEEILDQFAITLSADSSWMGYLKGVNDYKSLIEKLNNRITHYREYLNYNVIHLPNEIVHSKTIPGIPISNTAHILKSSGILKNEVSLLIRLDQYEDLERIHGVGKNLGKLYQEIIHKLIGMRDTSVSYRIGTRDFAWDKEKKKVFGTDIFIESRRDYDEIDLNEIQRRPENRKKSWIFPRFAEDIFARRLHAIDEDISYERGKYIIQVFGRSLSPEDKVKLYIGSNSSRSNILKYDESWPKEWKDFLNDLVNKDVLGAKFAEAWARQKGKESIINNIPSEEPYYWDSKRWWRKERIDQALMQLASRNRQNLHWSGYEDVINLSGGNILAFIHLSKYIWNVWLRENRNRDMVENIPKINNSIQNIGIKEASHSWFEDIKTERGGDRRYNFIRYIGNYFYKKLTEDIAMSYPGHNGFSLEIKELDSSEFVKAFLNEASDFGDLYRVTHTSRSKGQGKRIKWYLSPILSPYFKIPSKQTKEPYYINISRVKEWLYKSEAFTKSEIREHESEINFKQSRLLF